MIEANSVIAEETLHSLTATSIAIDDSGLDSISASTSQSKGKFAAITNYIASVPTIQDAVDANMAAATVVVIASPTIRGH